MVDSHNSRNILTTTGHAGAQVALSGSQASETASTHFAISANRLHGVAYPALAITEVDLENARLRQGKG